MYMCWFQTNQSVKLYLVSCTAKFALPLSAADGCSLSAALGHLVAGSTCSYGLTAVLWCFLQEIWQKTDLNQKDTLYLYSWGYSDFIHWYIDVCKMFRCAFVMTLLFLFISVSPSLGRHLQLFSFHHFFISFFFIKGFPCSKQLALA